MGSGSGELGGSEGSSSGFWLGGSGTCVDVLGLGSSGPSKNSDSPRKVGLVAGLSSYEGRRLTGKLIGDCCGVTRLLLLEAAVGVRYDGTMGGDGLTGLNVRGGTMR